MNIKITFPSLVMTILLFVLYTENIFCQNNYIQWFTFNSGFSEVKSSVSILKSALGQPLVGSSRQNNSLVQSGFLAAPILVGKVVGIDKYEDTPVGFLLNQNYPNPFNPNTLIKYSIPVKTFVQLKVFDILGKEVAVLVNEEKESGLYTIKFNAGNFATGLYVYQIRAGNYFDTKKMLLLK